MQVLTPLQDARFLVDSYPSPVDPVLMSKLVAEELRDPSANHVLSSAESKFGVSMPSEAFPQFAGQLRVLAHFLLPAASEEQEHALQACDIVVLWYRPIAKSGHVVIICSACAHMTSPALGRQCTS